MKKIVITSVIVGIVLLLGVTTLILGLLPVGMNEYVQLPNTVYVYCHKTSDFNAGKEIYKNIEGGSDSDVEKINTIYNLFNSSFQQKALSALFNGQIKNKTEIVKNEKGISKTISKNRGEDDENITLVFCYKNPQKLEYNGEEIEYTYLFFEISAEDEMKNVVMGVRSEDPAGEDGDEGLETISYIYSYQTLANFSELYEYVNEVVSSEN